MLWAVWGTALPVAVISHLLVWHVWIPRESRVIEKEKEKKKTFSLPESLPVPLAWGSLSDRFWLFKLYISGAKLIYSRYLEVQAGLGISEPKGEMRMEKIVTSPGMVGDMCQENKGEMAEKQKNLPSSRHGWLEGGFMSDIRDPLSAPSSTYCKDHNPFWPNPGQKEVL